MLFYIQFETNILWTCRALRITEVLHIYYCNSRVYYYPRQFPSVTTYGTPGPCTILKQGYMLFVQLPPETCSPRIKPLSFSESWDAFTCICIVMYYYCIKLAKHQNQRRYFMYSSVQCSFHILSWPINKKIIDAVVYDKFTSLSKWFVWFYCLIHKGCKNDGAFQFALALGEEMQSFLCVAFDLRFIIMCIITNENLTFIYRLNFVWQSCTYVNLYRQSL